MSSTLKGKYICFTGAVEGFTRADLEQMATEYGFTFMNSVTRATNLVVKGERPGKTKLDKAFNNGVRIISAEDFIMLLDSNEEDYGLPEETVKETKKGKAERQAFYNEQAEVGIF
ncbi:MAG: BRCT domain-containing protein [Hyphomonas sp.]|nr:BRCT domain-containing protein [Hyphomonas sp.]